METKYVECTGSPKPFFDKKETFLNIMSKFGWQHGKMSKKNNRVSVLACDSKDAGTAKLSLAAELGVEILTYEEIVDLFDLETEIGE
ncbi:MAG: hypothetical protein WC755_08260 [Candidatus Woesearchaeota archaeon]|jgi:hypothetical protein